MATGDTQVALIVSDLQNLQMHCIALVAAMGSGAAAFSRSVEAVGTAYGSQVHSKRMRGVLHLLTGAQPVDDKAEEFDR